MEIYKINTVWHSIHGCGTIKDLCHGMLEIAFPSGLKRINVAVWGTHLFDREDEYRDLFSEAGLDQKKMEKKYIPYRQCRDLTDCIKDPQIELAPFFGRGERTIALLLNCRVKHGRQIVGIDLESGSIANIVDTNGSRYGCHTDQKEWDSVTVNTMIRAHFVYCPGEYINTMRIISDFNVVGCADLRHLREERQIQCQPEFIQDFESIRNFCKTSPNTKGFLMVNFSGTKVNHYRTAYQLKMGEYFVDIRTPDFQFDETRPWYYGMALLGFGPGQKRMKFHAVNMFGSFLTEKEMETRKQEGQIMGEAIRKRELEYEKHLGKPDQLELGRESDETIDEQIWYHDHFLADYDNEMAYIYEELDQEYEGLTYDYCGDTMEEYSDYNDELEGYCGE